MNSKRLWATTTTIFALSVLDPCSSGVWAATRAICPEDWEWSRNSLGQDPCVVASVVAASCLGNPNFVAGQLGANETYVRPQRTSDLGLKCNCNTVMYSLWTACALCQGRRIYSWTEWIAECDNGISIAKYPHDIPQGTAIPRWALYDVTILQNQTYDDSVAKRVGRDPEATPGPISTISSSSSASGPTNIANNSGGKPSTGVIVGSVVGGVVVGAGVVVLVVFGLIWYNDRRKSKGSPSPSPNIEGRETSYVR